MFDWRTADPHTFESAAKMLLRLVFPGLQGIDGSGGDGGKDAILTTESGEQIAFEIKSHTGRLTNSSKRQIQRSLQTLLDQADPPPDRWILILPIEHTPAELTWFETKLAAIAGDVTIEWWGPPWLNGAVASNEAILRYLEGPDAGVLQRAKEFNHEQAVLATGDDLTTRVGNLHQRAGEMSPHWRWDFAVTGDTQTHILRAKHPDAASEDPITLTPTFVFGDEDRGLQERFSKALKYGGDVAIPGRCIAEFDIDASPQTRAMLAHPGRIPEEFRLVSHRDTTGLPVHADLCSYTATGDKLTSWPVTFLYRMTGQQGLTVVGQGQHNLLTVAIRTALVDGQLAHADLNVDVGPLAGHPVARVRAVLDALRGPHGGPRAARVALLFHGSETPGQVSDDEDPFASLEELHDLAAALEVLQEHVGVTLAMPGNPTADDAHHVIAGARALQGERVRLPGDTWKIAVKPERAAEFAQTVQGRGGIYVACSQAELTIDDLSIPYGPLAAWAPTVELTNRAELDTANPDSPDPVIARLAVPDGIFWLARDTIDDEGNPLDDSTAA